MPRDERGAEEILTEEFRERYSTKYVGDTPALRTTREKKCGSRESASHEAVFHLAQKKILFVFSASSPFPVCACVCRRLRFQLRDSRLGIVGVTIPLPSPKHPHTHTHTYIHTYKHKTTTARMRRLHFTRRFVAAMRKCRWSIFTYKKSRGTTERPNSKGEKKTLTIMCLFL